MTPNVTITYLGLDSASLSALRGGLQIAFPDSSGPSRLRTARLVAAVEEFGTLRQRKIVEQMDWDNRYSDEDFIYGSEPNAFLVEQSSKLVGPVFSIAEGEGRNAIYLATLGLQVYCVDGSAVGLAKARKLAGAKGVGIQTHVAELATYEPATNCYMSVISISAHLPSSIRNRLYPLIERCILPNGVFLLEAYSEDQLRRNTGGPNEKHPFPYGFGGSR